MEKSKLVYIMLNKIINRKFTVLPYLVLLSFVIYHKWLIFPIFVDGDGWFYYTNVMKSLPNLSTWSPIGKDINITLWRIPSEILYFITGDTSLGLKVSTFIPYIILTPLASYILLKDYFKESKAIIGGVLFYMSNTYYLSINSQAHTLLPIAFNLVIISFVLFKRAWTLNSSFYWALTVVLLFFSLAYDIRATYIGILIYIVYVLFNYQYLDFRLIPNILKYSILFVLLNLYWLLTFSIVGGGSGVGRNLFGTDFLTLTNSITLYYPFWIVDSPIQWFKVNDIPFYYWFFPIIAILSIVFSYRKKKEVVFFSTLLVIGVFLSKMNNAPLDTIYSWFYNNLLGFNAFRESSKFYIITLISYTYFIANLIHICKGFFKNAILFFIFFVLIINITPIITGNAGAMYAPVRVPESYITFSNYIESQEKFFDVLWVPGASKFSFKSNMNAALSLAHINQRFHPNSNIEFEDSQSFNLFLDENSIKYVVVPIKDINEDPFYWYGGKKNTKIRDWFIQELDKVDWLEKKEYSFSDLEVYENKNYKEKIYFTYKKESIYKDWKDPEVEFSQITPAEYKVRVKNLKDIGYINFGNTYNTNWKMRIGDFKWYKFLYEKNYFVEDSKHSKSELGFNSFEISPEYIKSNFDNSVYKENTDGSIDFEFTLYFKPETLFYIGATLSLFTLFILLTYIISFLVNPQNYNKKFTPEKT
jgi:hypothetical protein